VIGRPGTCAPPARGSRGRVPGGGAAAGGAGTDRAGHRSPQGTDRHRWAWDRSCGWRRAPIARASASTDRTGGAGTGRAGAPVAHGTGLAGGAGVDRVVARAPVAQGHQSSGHQSSGHPVAQGTQSRRAPSRAGHPVAQGTQSRRAPSRAGHRSCGWRGRSRRWRGHRSARDHRTGTGRRHEHGSGYPGADQPRPCTPGRSEPVITGTAARPAAPRSGTDLPTTRTSGPDDRGRLRSRRGGWCDRPAPGPWRPRPGRRAGPAGARWWSSAARWRAPMPPRPRAARRRRRRHRWPWRAGR
jgi:hypothetical protein